MNKTGMLALAGLLLAVFIVVSTNISSADTIYVDDVPGSGVANPAENYTVLQQAFDNATAGDVIFIFNGTYDGNVTVAIPCIIRGEHLEMVVLELGTNRSSLTINCTNTTVHNITIEQTAFRNTGIYLDNAYNTTLHNLVLLNTSTGIRCDGAENVSLQRCTFQNCNRSISSQGTANLTISNSTFFGTIVEELNLTETIITAFNTTFNGSVLHFNDANSTLMVHWYLHVNVEDGAGSPVQNVKVAVFDNVDRLVHEENTDINGEIGSLLQVQEYKHNITGTQYLSPYKLKAGNGTNYSILVVGVNKSMDMILILGQAQPECINITDVPNGTNLDTIDLPVGVFLGLNASSFNNSVGGYVGLADVNWSITNLHGAECRFQPDIPSVLGGQCKLFSGLADGISYLNASYFNIWNNTWENDSLKINILPPTIDYINVMDGPGPAALEVQDQDIAVGVDVLAHAHAYNNSIGRLYTVAADWAIVNTSANASCSPLNGTSSTLYSGWNPGTAAWTAEYGGIVDTVTFTITPPKPDYLAIMNRSDGTGVNVTNMVLKVGQEFQVFLMAFNKTTGLIGNAASNWTLVNDASTNATIDMLNGTSTNITSGWFGGTLDIKGEYHGLEIIESLDVMAPTMDYLLIVVPGDTSMYIMDRDVPVGKTITGISSGFNYTTGYVCELVATWSVVNSDGGSATTTKETNFRHRFYSGTTAGNVTWRASFSSMEDTVQFQIMPPEVDHVRLTKGNQIEISDQDVPVGHTIIGYAEGWNVTSGFVERVQAQWTVSVIGGGGSTTTPSPSESSQFQAGLAEDTVTWRITYLGMTDEVVITIIAPTVDFVKIHDAPEGSGSEITVLTVNVGFKIMGYLAGFNDTSGYVRDVQAFWEVENIGNSTAISVNRSGKSSEFQAWHHGGTAIWKAEIPDQYSTTITITIRPPEVDYIYIAKENHFEYHDRNAPVGKYMKLHSAGWNYTSGVVQLQKVEWLLTNSQGSQSELNETNDHNATVYMGLEPGLVQVWSIDSSGRTDAMNITILPPTVDYIRILEGPGEFEDIAFDRAFPVGITKSLYAGGFNESSGPVEEMEVNWSYRAFENCEGYITSMHGWSTQFLSGLEGGYVRIIAEDEKGNTHTLYYDVIPPQVDRVEIVYFKADGNYDIEDQIVVANKEIRGYCASYNDTAGYIGDVEANWSVTNKGAHAFCLPEFGFTSRFNAGYSDGTASWYAEFNETYDVVKFQIQNYPIADFEIDDTARAGLEHIFNGLPSKHADGFKWDLNRSDGLDWKNPDYTATVFEHVFEKEGEYNITLQVSNMICNATKSMIITVLEGVPPQASKKGPSGSNVSITTKVSLTFDEPMNKTTVESAFAYFDDTRGNWTITDGHMEWNQDGTKFTFTPDDYFYYGTKYHFVVNTQAQDLVGNHITAPIRWNFTTKSAEDSDNDGDEMDDGWEIEFGFDPFNATDAEGDFDSDGLTNFGEYTFKTDPTLSDTDNDTLPDGWELQFDMDPFVNDAVLDADEDDLLNKDEYAAGSNPRDEDSDNDGIPDGWEVEYGLDPNSPVDAFQDVDDDGATNLDEYNEGTNPFDASSKPEEPDEGFEFDTWLFIVIGEIAAVAFLGIVLLKMWKKRAISSDSEIEENNKEESIETLAQDDASVTEVPSKEPENEAKTGVEEGAEQQKTRNVKDDPQDGSG